MPLILAMPSGGMPFSHAAWMMTLEIWSCPQPGHSEDLPPVYSDFSKSITLSFITLTRSPPESLESCLRRRVRGAVCHRCRRRCEVVAAVQQATPCAGFRRVDRHGLSRGR